MSAAHLTNSDVNSLFKFLAAKDLESRAGAFFSITARKIDSCLDAIKLNGQSFNSADLNIIASTADSYSQKAELIDQNLFFLADRNQKAGNLDLVEKINEIRDIVSNNIEAVDLMEAEEKNDAADGFVELIDKKEEASDNEYPDMEGYTDVEAEEKEEGDEFTHIEENDAETQVAVDGNIEPNIFNLQHGNMCDVSLFAPYLEAVRKENGLEDGRCAVVNIVDDIRNMENIRDRKEELIFIPVSIKGEGKRKALFSRLTPNPQYMENHMAVIVVDNKNKKIYYFDPKGIEPNSAMTTKPRLDDKTSPPPSVRELINGLNDEYLGYDIVISTSKVQGYFNTKDCVPLCCLRMEEHVQAMKAHQEVGEPKTYPDFQGTRMAMSEKMRSNLLKPAIILTASGN